MMQPFFAFGYTEEWRYLYKLGSLLACYHTIFHATTTCKLMKNRWCLRLKFYFRSELVWFLVVRLWKYLRFDVLISAGSFY